MAIHRDLFFEVGGFDEDLIYGGIEDILFGYLASKINKVYVIYSLGMSVRHIPHPVGLAHQNYDLTWEVVSYKYPEFYELNKNGYR